MEFGRTDKESILIIDDVTSNLMTLAAIIRSAGYSPRPVSSVELAERTMEVMKPELILLDVTMPKMNGYDYCRMLKNDARTRDIPVIFISGLNTPSDRVKGFECGAVDFISKPFEQTEVLLRVNTHLETYHLQKRLYQDNRQLHNLVNRQLAQLEYERKKMILALAKLSEDRADSTGKHLDNVSANCRIVATGLSLTHRYEKQITNEFINTIETASRLHDIGKMAIPDDILLKEGPLTNDERLTMMKHTTIGVDTLRDIYSENTANAFIAMALEIAYFHHEKWDGSGYPTGTKGAEIPLPARIMAVVDVYDALVSKRCYKPAYSHEDAIEYIKSESGKSFDPDVVQIFVRLEKRLKRNINEEAASDMVELTNYTSDSRR